MKKIFLLIAVMTIVSSAMADEGMWLLSRLKKESIEKMQKMGCKLSAEDIYDVNKPGIKDAIVGLGNEGRPFSHFCSGEIISPNGLMLTNHHCGFNAIQAHSTVEHDYLYNGFWAYNMQDELTNEGTTASILERMEDVTDKVNAVLSDKMTEIERKNAIDRISAVIVTEAVKGTVFRAQVQEMFEGNQFFLFVYTIYQDVRLVGAPPQSMGKFGGDTDNWMWTRHTADFSMFRIYTGPDGKPAPYSPNNIPLKPKHYLPVSAKGINDGDFAMILGFPGTTDRYTTSYGLKNTMTNVNDIRYKVRTEKLNVMKEGMASSDAIRIQYAAKHAQCANYWKYSYEQNKALENLNTMGNKQEIERKFTEWVNADNDRKSMYGTTLSIIKNNYEYLNKYAAAETYVQEALAGPEAHIFAFRLSKTLSEYCNTIDANRKAKLKEFILNYSNDFYKDFNADIDANLMAKLFKMYRENVSDDVQATLLNELIDKKFKGNYDKFAQTAKAKSIFMDQARFNDFINNPNEKVLKADIVAKAGEAFYETYMNVSSKTTQYKENIAKGDRLFVRGLMAMDPQKSWSPNANSTIRLTYGKVCSYSPRDGVIYDYYTTLKGVLEKEGPKGGEFEVPDRLKTLYAAKNYGNYGKDYLAVNFITDNDITGGNSGSAVINGNGELIGTAFDGNSEAMSGDIDFEENLQRCINLDTRYMLWIVDVYAGAKNLINEMKIIK